MARRCATSNGRTERGETMHTRYLAGLMAAVFVSAAWPGAAEAKRWGSCSWETRKMVDEADRIMQANSSAGIMTMRVSKPNNKSSMKMKFWSVGRDKMLVRILQPSRLKGMATLKVGEKVWYYMPRTDRIVRVGTSMLGDSWMGSHFTNDDLVKETQLYKHYTCASRVDTATRYKITLKPLPNAPVVWGKQVVFLRKSDKLPARIEYHGERGGLKRVMTFHDFRVMDGKKVPARMVLRPAGKSEYTEVSYQKIRFGVSIPGRYFSLRGLKR